MKGKKILDETIINGSRVFIENGEVKTVLNEDIQKSGYMSLDDCFDIILEEIKKIYELNKKL